MTLEPYPDRLLDELLDGRPEPLARHDARAAIRLAFVAALQLLAPSERAMLVLCDVAGFPVGEAATMLGVDTGAAQRALLRARCTLDARLAAPCQRPPADSSRERALLARFADAFERADVDGLVALLAEDVRVRLPPDPAEHFGRAAAGRVLAWVPFARVRLVPTRANADPAFELCLREGSRVHGLLVLALNDAQIADLTLFRDPAGLRCFRAPAPPPR